MWHPEEMSLSGVVSPPNGSGRQLPYQRWGFWNFSWKTASLGTLSEMEVLFCLRTFCCRYLHLTSTSPTQGIVFERYYCIGLKLRDFEVRMTGFRAQLFCLLSGVMLGKLLNLSEPW